MKLDNTLVTAPVFATPGIKFVKHEVIDLDMIYIPPMVDNPVRKRGKDPHNVDRLAQSLSRGIQYDKVPPIVRKNSRIVDGKHYTYELICGNHRCEALQKIGKKEWIFSVYEVSINGISYEDSVRTLQLVENDHSPALESSDEDISNVVSRLIEKGSTLVGNDEQSIRDYVETYCQNKAWQTKAKIVRQAVRQVGAYQDVVTYTANDAYKWISSKTDYTVAGRLDNTRRQYGWTVLEGYEYEYVISAARKLHETGKPSYFICHTKAPTEARSLEERREEMVQNFNDLGEMILTCADYYSKHGEFPWEIRGFLPQDHKAKEVDLIMV